MSKNKHMLLGIGLTVVLTAVGYITLLEPMISYFKINQSAVNIDIQTSKTKRLSYSNNHKQSWFHNGKIGR